MMQAGKDYGVEVITAYENRRVGDVIYPNGVYRQALLRNGFVKLRAAPADAAAEPTSEETERSRRRQGRLGLTK